MSRSARLRTVIIAVLMALTLAGCGSGSGDSEGSGTSGSDETSGDGSTAATATPDTKVEGTKKSSTPTLRITFKGDTVTPQGKSMELKAGQPLKLHITADQPGEIHVHSTPEQEIEYDAGTTDKTLKIKQPGVVDVESHDLDKLIVQLEVR